MGSPRVDLLEQTLLAEVRALVATGDPRERLRLLRGMESSIGLLRDDSVATWRDAGAPWESIADELGMTKQGAWLAYVGKRNHLRG